MEKDKSILIQKQVRDNSEDLRREVIDLKNWEEEMKRKEAELLNAGDKQIKDLPPVRSKKKKTIENSPPIASTSKSAPNRIKSSDYEAWDKFDVDAAIRKLDDEDLSDASEENMKESAEKKHSEATKLKELGNVFVQQKLYDKAIESYSEAIKLFPYDEVFYANRALCYLKQENLYSAEADCTAALQLDDCYVKAYHRRATARMGLEEYNEAKKDIEKMLNLEPANKEAKSMLAQVNKKLEKSKSPIVSSGISPESPVKKKIVEKVWNTAKLKEQTAIQKQLMLDMQKVSESVNSTGLTITEIPNDSENSEQEQITEKLPDWLPKLNGDFSILKPIQMSPHLRSKKPLKNIPIKEADFESNILPKLEKLNPKKVEKPKVDENDINIKTLEKRDEGKKPKEDSTNFEGIDVNKKQISDKQPQDLIKPSRANKTKLEKPSILSKFIEERQEESKETAKRIVELESPKIVKIVEEIPKVEANKPLQKNSIKSDVKVSKEPPKIEVPPVPKTSVQFLMDWKINQSFDFKYLYLKQISPETIPTMFKDSMDSDIFGDIISVLLEKFTLKEKNVFEYLKHLSNVKRFRTLIMFIEKSTKEALKDLLTHCKTQEDRSDEEIEELRQKYEL